MIKLIVGLGNPGQEYAGTRHNVGFWLLEAIANANNVQFSMDKSVAGLVARLNSSDSPLWLLLPQTFMNRSGRSVAALARYYKIASNEILVAHDDLDLPAGQVKLKQGGGHAGHNGLRDIHAQIGNSEYWRLRLGIGHPGIREEVVNWVLGTPSPDDRSQIGAAIQRATSAFPAIRLGNLDQAMRLLNTRAPKPQ